PCQGATADHGRGDRESAGGQGEAAVQGGALHRLGVGGGVLRDLLELGAGGAVHLGRRAGAPSGEELRGQAGVVPELGAGGLAVVPLLPHHPGTPGDLAAQVRGDLTGAPGGQPAFASGPDRPGADRGRGGGDLVARLVEVLVPATGVLEVRQPLTQRPRPHSPNPGPGVIVDSGWTADSCRYHRIIGRRLVCRGITRILTVLDGGRGRLAGRSVLRIGLHSTVRRAIGLPGAVGYGLLRRSLQRTRRARRDLL